MNKSNASDPEGSDMAKIWPVYEGKEPTRGGPWAEIPVSEAIELFELQPDDFVSDLEITPRFGNVDRDLWHAGFKYIVVEIEHSEGRRAKWRSGFYRSPITPREAFDRLVRRALIAELGDDNVIRVDWKPAVDSRGQEAIKFTIVIPQGATQKLSDRAVLDALVSLQERLSEMREERTPIIEYATEAELQQDGGSQS